MDSAAGSAKEGRDRATQAILPVRGKIINTQKNTLDKLLKNAEILAMIKAFGLKLADNKVIVEESKLRYGKIIIMADSDVDGAHIQNLFLTFIWNFAPDLLRKGYIYAAQPPLYRIIKGKNSLYLANDVELQKYQQEHKGESYDVQRFKGLGEMSAEELELSTMSPETRTLKQIIINNEEEIEKLFEDLMGSKTQPRKDFITANAHKAQVVV